MTETGADMRTITLEKGLATFLNALSGKNRSAATVRAYQTDITQFISFLHANNVSIHTPADVEKVDVVEYLSSLAKRELTGIARARKMSAIREYFRFLEGIGVIAKSPTIGIETPKREKNRVCPTFYTRSGPVICGPFSINSAMSRERYLIA